MSNDKNVASDDLRTGGVEKRAHLTVTEDELLAGKLCSCDACVREGPHEPDCGVHDEPRGGCTCARTEQTEAAG